MAATKPTESSQPSQTVFTSKQIAEQFASADELAAKGRALMSENRLAEAAVAMQSAVSLRRAIVTAVRSQATNLATDLSDLAHLRLSLGQNDDAEACAREAIAIDRNHALLDACDTIISDAGLAAHTVQLGAKGCITWAAESPSIASPRS